MSDGNLGILATYLKIALLLQLEKK